MIIRQDSMFEALISPQDIEIKKPVIKKRRAPKPKETVASFLHLGAGVQSSTLVEMMVEGDLPPVDAVIFADTGNEPSWVYEQVEYLKTRLSLVNIPLEVVKKPNSEGLVKDLVSPSLRFATMPLYSFDPETKRRAILRRQCTNEYKIIPCDNFILSWMLERGYAKRNKAGARRVSNKVQVINWYGISADEKHRQGKQAQAWQISQYPLIDQNKGRIDCEIYLRTKGLKVPKKSSCIVCPYHNDEYWLDLKSNAPDEFEQACIFDEWLRSEDAKLYGNSRTIRDELYLHELCKPLRDIDFEAEIARRKSKQLDMFKSELVAEDSCASDGGFSCMS